MEISGNPDVFFSLHTESSLHIVEAIAENLEADGIKCWYAARDSHGTYAEDIAAAVLSCRVFLIVLNQQASESVHVLNELDLVTKRLANREPVHVVSFRISNDEIGIGAQYYLGRITWVDGEKPPIIERIEELLQTVRSLLGVKAETAPRRVQNFSGRYQLIENRPEPHPVFVGREELLPKIDSVFSGGSRVLFLEGIGGIGKSELAKQYAVRYSAEYDRILFFTFSGSLRETLCDDGRLEITGVMQTEGESQEEFFHRKLQILHQITDARTLLIVDNFDTEQDPDLEEFLKGGYRVLFTTRCKHSEYNSLAVGNIADMNVLISAFEQNYGENLDEDDKPYIERLIRKFDCHTYMTELLAKQMAAGFYSGEELWTLYDQGEFRQAADESIEGLGGRKKTYDHICELFSVSQLPPEEKQLLMELSVLDIHAVPARLFKEWAQLSSFDGVNSLIRKSWVYKSGKNLSMHPLVQEAVHARLRPDAEICEDFLDQIGLWLYHAWGRKDAQNQKSACHVRALAAYFSPFDGQHMHVWTRIPDFLWQAGDFENAVKYAEILLNTSIYAHGEASMHTGYAARILGECYRGSGRDREAMEAYEKALTYMKASGEGDSDDLAWVYERLAMCYTWECGRDLQKALACAKECLAIRERLRERMQKGEQLHRYIDRYCKFSYDNVNTGISIAYQEISRVYMEIGDYEAGLEYAKKAVETMGNVEKVAEATRVSVSFREGVCYYLIGVRYRAENEEESAENELGKARDLFERVLKVQEEQLGSESLTVISTEEYLADTYAALGRYADASNYYVHVASILKKCFPGYADRLETVTKKMRMEGAK